MSQAKLGHADPESLLAGHPLHFHFHFLAEPRLLRLDVCGKQTDCFNTLHARFVLLGNSRNGLIDSN